MAINEEVHVKGISRRQFFYHLFSIGLLPVFMGIYRLLLLPRDEKPRKADFYRHLAG